MNREDREAKRFRNSELGTRVIKLKAELLRDSELGNPYTLVCLYLLYRLYEPRSTISQVAEFGVSNLETALKILALPEDDPLRPSTEVASGHVGYFRQRCLSTEKLRKEAFLFRLTVSIYHFRQLAQNVPLEQIDTGPISKFLGEYLVDPAATLTERRGALDEAGSEDFQQWAELARDLDEILKLKLLSP